MAAASWILVIMTVGGGVTISQPMTERACVAVRNKIIEAHGGWHLRTKIAWAECVAVDER